MILVAAFKESILWGVLSLLVPCAAFVFVAKHWSAGKMGFLISLAGIVVIGVVIAGASGAIDMEVGLLLM